MVMQSDGQIVTVEWIGFSFALLSLLCSCTTLLLIYLMRTWNGYLLLITSMTCCQVLYDVNYVLGVVPTFDACVTWHFLYVLGGLSVAIWTNIISFVVMFVVRNIRSFNIYGNYVYFFALAVVFPAALAIVDVCTVDPATQDDDKPFLHCVGDGSPAALTVVNIYYWGRLLSIIFNFLVFFYTSFKVRQLAAARPGRASHTSSSDAAAAVARGANEHQKMAVHSLASRMKYYPLAQALMRAGAAWNEFDSYRYSSFPSSVLGAICSPSTGTIYFVIFLLMQPRAWETLKCLITWDWSSLNEEPTPNESYFRREDMETYAEDDLESIIDINEVRVVSSADFSPTLTTKSVLHFDPSRKPDF